MTKPHKLTPKQRVLRKWPTAYCVSGSSFYAGLFVIRDTALRENIYSNHNYTPNAAWADAARRLERK